MKLSKKQRIIGASVVGSLAIGALGIGLWQWNLESTETAAYERADSDMRTTSRERNRAAAELNRARAEALAAHTLGVELSGMADPALLETPTVRDDLTKAVAALAEAASLEPNDSGALAVPAAVIANRAHLDALPKDRDAKRAATAKLNAAEGSLRREGATLDTQIARITEASGAVEEAELELVASAHAKGTAAEPPKLASQESKDGFVAAVAELQTPTKDADLVAILQAYQGAWAAVLASGEEAAQGQDPASLEPTYVNGILIANKTYPLPSWWGDGLTGETVAAFDAMRAEAAGQGFDLYISSGFRSYAAQASIYNSLVAEVGVAGADLDTARPGHSEHQTGLTLDLNCICEGFGHQADGQWVAANAHRFGFIVRYPPGKEHVTGYIWEPWHLRYLGVENATKVYNSGVSLEEYLGITSRYG